VSGAKSDERQGKWLARLTELEAGPRDGASAGRVEARVATNSRSAPAAVTFAAVIPVSSSPAPVAATPPVAQRPAPTGAWMSAATRALLEDQEAASDAALASAPPGATPQSHAPIEITAEPGDVIPDPVGAQITAPMPVSTLPRVHRLPVVIEQPIRSGQIVYAEETDLIVLAGVNPGAQIMADGNIHIYGALRGRANAGVKGAADARIFCQKFDPELVGIDAAFLGAEDLPSAQIGKAVQVILRDGRCVVIPLP